MSRLWYELDMAVTQLSKAPQRLQVVVVVLVLVCAVLVLLTMHSHGEME